MPPTCHPPLHICTAVFIAICARLGLIRPAEWSTYDTDDVAAGLQNFLICLEMFAAAVAHAYAFPPRVRRGGVVWGGVVSVLCSALGTVDALDGWMPASAVGKGQLRHVASIPTTHFTERPPNRCCHCAPATATAACLPPATITTARRPPPMQDYMDASRPPPGVLNNLRVMFDVRDVMSDVNIVLTDTVQQTTDNLTGAGGGWLRGG